MMRGCGRGAALVSDLGAGAARGAGGVGNWSDRGAGGMTSCGVGPDGADGIEAGGIGAGGTGGDWAFAAAVMMVLATAIWRALRIKRALLIQLSPLARGGSLLPQQPAPRLEDCQISNRRAR